MSGPVLFPFSALNLCCYKNIQQIIPRFAGYYAYTPHILILWSHNLFLSCVIHQKPLPIRYLDADKITGIFFLKDKPIPVNSETIYAIMSAIIRNR